MRAFGLVVDFDIATPSRRPFQPYSGTWKQSTQRIPTKTGAQISSSV